MSDLEAVGTPVTLATIGYVRYKRPTLKRRPRESKKNVLAKRFSELVELNEFAKQHGGIDRVIGMLNHLKAFKDGTFSTD